jgi:hypothetical protein
MCGVGRYRQERWTGFLTLHARRHSTTIWTGPPNPTQVTYLSRSNPNLCRTRSCCTQYPIFTHAGTAVTYP